MNIRINKLSLFGVVLVAFSVFSCSEDDPKVFDQPVISVVADNTTPFADEDITFTVQVAAAGGLKEVTLNGTVIKAYTNNEKADQFEHVVTLTSGTAFGNKLYSFSVSDDQSEVKTAIIDVTVDVKNPAERGNPLSITKFDATVYPNGKIGSVSTAMQNQGWGDFYAGEFFFGVDNPLSGNVNKVVQYKKTNTWGWEQYVGADVDLVNASQISEDEWEALANGERVLQVNIYFQHIPAINSETGVNESQEFPTAGGYIPIEIYIGNKAKWGFVGGVNVGRKIWLRGKLTAGAAWQTVTLEAYNPDENNEPDAPSNIDPTVGFDQIDRLSVACNPGGFMRTANDENIHSGGFNAPFDHNNYFFYNMRLIDTEEKDNNPNL